MKITRNSISDCQPCLPMRFQPRRMRTRAAIQTVTLFSSLFVFLFGAKSFAATVIADSVADFSMTQGQKNWSYGYYVGAYSMNGFQPFTSSFNCCGLGDIWGTGQNVWTVLWNWGGHPNGLSGNGGRDQVIQGSVRRWVSTFRGPVTIQGVTSSSYITNVTLNWSNTFRVGQAPSNPMGLGGTDLIASLLMRLGRDFGGTSFGTIFWRQVELRPAAATTQAAVDNFILAACAAVNQNLCGIFQSTWKFPVSATALSEAQTRWGAPTVLRPPVTISKDAGNNLLIKWQSQVNTSYQLQGTTNLQHWVDVGTPIAGDGTIRTATNSSAGFANRFFRLKLQ